MKVQEAGVEWSQVVDIFLAEAVGVDAQPADLFFCKEITGQIYVDSDGVIRYRWSLGNVVGTDSRGHDGCEGRVHLHRPSIIRLVASGLVSQLGDAMEDCPVY